MSHRCRRRTHGVKFCIREEQRFFRNVLHTRIAETGSARHRNTRNDDLVLSLNEFRLLLFVIIFKPETHNVVY